MKDVWRYFKVQVFILALALLMFTWAAGWVGFCHILSSSLFFASGVIGGRAYWRRR